MVPELAPQLRQPIFSSEEPRPRIKSDIARDDGFRHSSAHTFQPTGDTPDSYNDRQSIDHIREYRKTKSTPIVLTITLVEPGNCLVPVILEVSQY